MTASPSLVLSSGDSGVNKAPRALCSSRVCAGDRVTNNRWLDEHHMRAEWRGVGGGGGLRRLSAVGAVTPISIAGTG